MPPSRLLSLPAELRIRIYEYALDPLADPGRIHPLLRIIKGHHQNACCGTVPRKRNPRCDCAMNTINPALLRVNKQVSSEAMPVLCSLFELRVRIAPNGKEFARVLKGIPATARPHMRQLLLVSENAGGPGDFTQYHDQLGASDVETYRTDRCDGLAGLDKYWKTIKQELPQLRKIRLHADLSTEEIKNFKFVLWTLKGLKTLSKLQYFRLELHQRWTGEAMWTERFKEDMQAAIICKMFQLIDGTFEIDLELIGREPPTHPFYHYM